LKTVLSIFFFFIIISLKLIADDINISYQKDSGIFILENELFVRTLNIQEQTLTTSDWIFKKSNLNIAKAGTKEFSFSINKQKVYPGSNNNFFEYLDHEIKHLDDRSQLIIHLVGRINAPAKNVDVQIFYEIYSDLAAVRKWLVIKNIGDKELMIEDLFWEDVNIDPGYNTGVDIFKEYGRSWTKPPYIGGKDDPAILIKNNNINIILGNEAPGIMKYTSVYRKGKEIKIGFNPSDHYYPFRKNLSKNKSFKTPESFIIFSDNIEPELSFEQDLGTYIRKYLGVKLYKRIIKPSFLYNTWNPFRIDINETLIKELADSLKDSGVEYFIIDDGWQDHNGDWNPNKEKFPNGLKPVTDYIKNKGMKPGLWISLTIANADSKAFSDFKHLAVTDKNGEPANLHGWSNNHDLLTMKIASPWYDYIKEKMRKLVLDNGIEYFKIDLAMVKSAYILEPERSGSYDQNEWFKGREEYLYTSYERTTALFDELSAEFPDLIIDCTFELWGDWHIIDYALVKHADVDWISNFYSDPPEGSRTVRSLAYHHGLTVPTSSMVIGNQKMEAKGYKFSFISNFGSMPIMLGDPRELSIEDKIWYKKMSEWFSKMDQEYGITEFYQTAGIFNAPSKKDWDGFFRYNTEIDGGIVCVFRNDSPDYFRHIRIPYCRDEMKYEIINGENDQSLGTYLGLELRARGVKLIIDDKNTAIALEIRPVD